MGSRGVVIEINLRYVVLQAPGQTHLIPNSAFLTSKLIRHAKVADNPSGEGR